MTPPRTAAPAPGAVERLDQLARGSCNREVASVLAGEGIAVEQFRAGTYNELRNGPSARVSQYEVWLYPRDRSGVLVVGLDNNCRPMQIYARQGADLQSFKAG